MKKTVCLVAILTLILPSLALAGGQKHGVAGFVIGEDISRFKDRVQMDTALPIRYLESAKEVEIAPTPGFKSGLVTYSTCKDPDKILRIKLKYSNSSLEFFDDLVDRVKKRLGEPDRYRGDAFGVMKAWKWSLTDDRGHSISLILQHNTMDVDEKLGNAVKMTDVTGMLAEQSCSEQKGGNTGPTRPGKGDWKLYVPY